MKYIWHLENAPEQRGTIYLTNISHSSVSHVIFMKKKKKEHGTGCCQQCLLWTGWTSKLYQLHALWQASFSANVDIHFHVSHCSWPDHILFQLFNYVLLWPKPGFDYGCCIVLKSSLCGWCWSTSGQRQKGSDCYGFTIDTLNQWFPPVITLGSAFFWEVTPQNLEVRTRNKWQYTVPKYPLKSCFLIHKYICLLPM